MSSVLEFMGMVMTAWALTVVENERTRFAGKNVLMQSDNMPSAVHWIKKCRARKGPRSGALISILSYLEARRGCCFRARHVTGVANTGLSTGDRATINRTLCKSRAM